MNAAFNYAKSQLLGLTFEPFSYTQHGLQYRWQVSAWVTWLCRWLVGIAEPLAQAVFEHYVRVEPAPLLPEAIVSRNLLTSGDGMVIDVDYDDTALLIDTIHVHNNSVQTYTVIAKAAANGKTYTLPFAAGVGVDQSISRGAQNRLGITITPNGRFDGVDWSIN